VDEEVNKKKRRKMKKKKKEGQPGRVPNRRYVLLIYSTTYNNLIDAKY
jgi:hypothetical protein